MNGCMEGRVKRGVRAFNVDGPQPMGRIPTDEILDDPAIVVWMNTHSATILKGPIDEKG